MLLSEHGSKSCPYFVGLSFFFICAVVLCSKSFFGTAYSIQMRSLGRFTGLRLQMRWNGYLDIHQTSVTYVSLRSTAVIMFGMF